MPTSFGGNFIEYSGTNLEGLGNVDSGAAEEGNLLTYDATVNRWKSRSDLRQVDVQNITTASNIIYTVELFAGVIMRNCNGAARTDTTDTAAYIVNTTVRPTLEMNNSFRILIFNYGVETLTLAPGTGVTIYGNDTMTTGVGQEYLVVVLDASSGSESVGFYAV